MVKGQDIKVTQNQIELKDDLLGLVEKTKNINYVTLEPSITYSKP